MVIHLTWVCGTKWLCCLQGLWAKLRLLFFCKNIKRKRVEAVKKCRTFYFDWDVSKEMKVQQWWCITENTDTHHTLLILLLQDSANQQTRCSDLTCTFCFVLIYLTLMQLLIIFYVFFTFIFESCCVNAYCTDLGKYICYFSSSAHIIGPQHSVYTHRRLKWFIFCTIKTQ